MFFNSVKEINRLRKEISRLSSKGMSNIYLLILILKGIITFQSKRDHAFYFKKNETKSKMENPIHSFREANLVLQAHIRIAN